MKLLTRLILVTVALFLFWHFLVISADLPKFILPSPFLVMQTFVSNFSLILKHAVVTGSEIILGLLAGTVLGSFTAICLAISPVARTIVRPMMVLSQALPVFALAPLLTLWLGYGLSLIHI